MSPLLAAAVMLSPHLGPDGASEAAWERFARDRPGEARRLTVELGPAARAGTAALLAHARKDDHRGRSLHKKEAAAVGNDALPAVLAALFDFDPSRRGMARHVLNHVYTDVPFPPDPAVGRAAAEAALVRIRGLSDIAALRPGLVRPAYYVSDLAYTRHYGVRVVPRLVELLDHPLPPVRAAAGREFQRFFFQIWIRDDGLLAPNFRVMLPDRPSPPLYLNPQWQADLAAATPVLARVLKEDPERSVRTAALIALAEAGAERDAVLPRLLAAWPAADGDETTGPLLDPARSRDFNRLSMGLDRYAAADPEDAEAVRRTLNRHLPAALERLGVDGVRRVGHVFLDFRTAAVAEPLSDAIQGFLAGLPEDDPDRANMAEGLAMLRERRDALRNPSPDAAPPLTVSQAYMNAATLAGGGLTDPDPRTRARAVVGLGEANDRAEAAELALAAARDPDPRVRAAAAYAFGERMEPDAATAPLRRLLGDPYAAVRLPAVRAWRRRGLDPAALVPLADDPNPAVALAAGEQ